MPWTGEIWTPCGILAASTRQVAAERIVVTRYGFSWSGSSNVQTPTITRRPLSHRLLNPGSHELLVSIQSAVQVGQVIQDGQGEDRIGLSHGVSLR